MAEAAVPSVLADGLAPSEIRRVVEDLLDAGARVVAVDFEGALALDADVAGELVRLQRRLDDVGARLVVRNLHGVTSEAVGW